VESVASPGIPAGVGVTWDPSLKTLTITSSSGNPQLQLDYDAANYTSFRASSTGDLFIQGGATSQGIVMSMAGNATISIQSVGSGGAVNSALKFWTNSTFRYKWTVNDLSNQFVMTNSADVAIITCDQNKNVVMGSAALATNATDGFVHTLSCAGTPSGTPTLFTGRVPEVIDSTNLYPYAYLGGAWLPGPKFNALWTSLVDLQTNQFIVTANGAFCFGSSGVGSPDVLLVRRGPGILSLENGANAQTIRFYGNTTGAKYGYVTHNGTDTVIDANSGGVKIGVTATTIGFFNTSPQAKQTSGANLTNNMTSGGTTDQVDTWSNLSTYSTDAAAIRNAVYQLARKLKQVNDGLRAYGLLT
jgi:hypothetical protein